MLGWAPALGAGPVLSIWAWPWHPAAFSRDVAVPFLQGTSARLQLSNLCLFCRTTFKEFAEKYGRDQRFRLVQKKKDQEHFFNQFILILKKRDKENRIRLRKMR